MSSTPHPTFVDVMYKASDGSIHFQSLIEAVCSMPIDEATDEPMAIVGAHQSNFGLFVPAGLVELTHSDDQGNHEVTYRLRELGEVDTINPDTGEYLPISKVLFIIEYAGRPLL